MGWDTIYLGRLVKELIDSQQLFIEAFRRVKIRYDSEARVLGKLLESVYTEMDLDKFLDILDEASDVLAVVDDEVGFVEKFIAEVVRIKGLLVKIGEINGGNGKLEEYRRKLNMLIENLYQIKKARKQLRERIEFLGCAVSPYLIKKFRGELLAKMTETKKLYDWSYIRERIRELPIEEKRKMWDEVKPDIEDNMGKAVDEIKSYLDLERRLVEQIQEFAVYGTETMVVEILRDV